MKMSMEPTAAELERASEWLFTHVDVEGEHTVLSLASLIAAVRAEHDSTPFIGSESWNVHWQLLATCNDDEFGVWDLTKSNFIAFGESPVAACQSALATVKETP